MEGAKYVVVEGRPVVLIGATERWDKVGGKLCEALRKEDLGMGLYNGNECIRLAGAVNEQSVWRDRTDNAKGVGSMRCRDFCQRRPRHVEAHSPALIGIQGSSRLKRVSTAQAHVTNEAGQKEALWDEENGTSRLTTQIVEYGCREAARGQVLSIPTATVQVATGHLDWSEYNVRPGAPSRVGMSEGTDVGERRDSTASWASGRPFETEDSSDDSLYSQQAVRSRTANSMRLEIFVEMLQWVLSSVAVV